MAQPANDPPDNIEQRLARLEQATGSAGPSALDKLLKYVPILALSNLLVSAPAFLISIGVAYFTFVQAEATEKMQIATVWPHVTADTSNLAENGEPQMRLNLANQGVGPALIKGMEVSYRGKAYPDPHALLRACCVPDGAIRLIISTSNGEVMRPGEEIDFLRFAPDALPVGGFERFEAARGEIGIRVCYCSVFDDCWIADNEREGDPKPVEQCPADWVQYGFPQSAPARR